MSACARPVHVVVASADPATRARLAGWLARGGWDVVAVRDAGEALLKVVETGAAVAFVDLEDQEAAGARSVEMMRVARPALPVVVITRDLSGQWLGRIAKAAPYLLMMKPLDRLEVEDVAASAVRRALN